MDYQEQIGLMEEELMAIGDTNPQRKAELVQNIRTLRHMMKVDEERAEQGAGLSDEDLEKMFFPRQLKFDDLTTSEELTLWDDIEELILNDRADEAMEKAIEVGYVDLLEQAANVVVNKDYPENCKETARKYCSAHLRK